VIVILITTESECSDSHCGRSAVIPALTLALIIPDRSLPPQLYSEPAKTRLQRILSEITQVIIPHGHIVLCYRAILAARTQYEVPCLQPSVEVRFVIQESAAILHILRC
jgi:hypothetical protein